MFKVRNRRPPYSVSLMKSTAHTALGCGMTTSGWRNRIGSRFFVRRGTFSRSWQYTRHSRLWFHRWPVDPKPITIFPEPPARLRGAQRGQRLNHRRIALGPIHQGPIVRGSPKSHCLTGPLNWKAAHRDQVRHDLPPLSRP